MEQQWSRKTSHVSRFPISILNNNTSSIKFSIFSPIPITIGSNFNISLIWRFFSLLGREELLIFCYLQIAFIPRQSHLISPIFPTWNMIQPQGLPLSTTSRTSLLLLKRTSVWVITSFSALTFLTLACKSPQLSWGQRLIEITSSLSSHSQVI